MEWDFIWKTALILVMLDILYQLHRVSAAILTAVEEVRLSLNHRLTEWKDETRATALDSAKAAYQAGMAEGQESERRRGEWH